MQAADLNKKRKRRRNKKGTGAQRRSDNDPLQSFNNENVDLSGLGGGEDAGDDGNDMEMPDFSGHDDDDGNNTKKQKTSSTTTEKRIFANTRDGTGRSTSGRNAWKERHKKGKFSNKKRKADRKFKQPLGI